MKKTIVALALVLMLAGCKVTGPLTGWMYDINPSADGISVHIDPTYQEPTPTEGSE